MKVKLFEIGRAALSRQGHDKGRWFVVVGVLDEGYVLIADGRTRLLEKPKKKQCKHLKWMPYQAETVIQRLVVQEHRQGMPLQNSDLRTAISAFMAQESSPAQVTGEARGHQKEEECALVQK
ncbi:MAG: KOW domain-containing RNA-binding protein [Clostridia bacterium]|nr:KOW domain-containing RNA-binding protein [Clostridia bacterium]